MDICLDTFIVDVYVDIPPKLKVWLVDLNPWVEAYTDPCLYSWEDFHKDGILPFKVIESEIGI